MRKEVQDEINTYLLQNLTWKWNMSIPVLKMLWQAILYHMHVFVFKIVRIDIIPKVLGDPLCMFSNFGYAIAMSIFWFYGWTLYICMPKDYLECKPNFIELIFVITKLGSTQSFISQCKQEKQLEKLVILKLFSLKFFP